MIPLVAGQITRYAIIHRPAEKILNSAKSGIRDGRFRCLEEIVESPGERLVLIKKCIADGLERSVKPHLSFYTMLTMLILVALLVASKSIIILNKPVLAAEIVILQALMLAILLGGVTIVDKLIRVKYENHMAMVFITATKNQSVAAAIAVMALGPKAALVPALIPAIQAPVAIAYLQSESMIKKLLTKPG